MTTNDDANRLGAEALQQFVHMDIAALRGTDAAHGALPTDGGEDADILRNTTSLFLHGLIDDRTTLDADYIAKRALARKLAAVVVATNALRAFSFIAEDNLVAARAVARRASRMAQTENLREYAFLANTILARVRRLTGNPHLATRILTTLADAAPQTWHPWLAWELMLSGSAEAARSRLTSLPDDTERAPATKAARALLAVLDAVRAGDRATFDASVTALTDATKDLPHLAREAALTLAAVDPSRDVTVRKASQFVAWLAGETADMPAVISGLAARADAERDAGDAVAYVLMTPTISPRRVLRVALPLVLAEKDSAGQPSIKFIRSPDRAQERREVATAILAFGLAKGFRDEDFFEKVYGATYDKGQHRGTLDTLLHRVREALEGVAEVVRDAGRIHLVPKAAFIIPDPRCAEPLSDRILRVIAELDRASAKDVAERLDVPLRTIQASLRDLAEEGAFEVSTEGRKNHYRIVDTTFSDPTLQ